MANNDVIRRPPLARTFDLPARDDLFGVAPGDHVQLLFTWKERMWVEVLDCCSVNRWTGLLRNSPFFGDGEVEYGSPVEFHPLDVIAIRPTSKRDLDDGGPQDL